MLSRIERVFMSHRFEDVRATFISRARFEAGRDGGVSAWMAENGFERVAVSDDQILTDDGREIFRFRNKAWALTQENHAKRVEAALVAAKEQALAARQSVRESIAAISCPQMSSGKPCGGALNKKGVCSSCVTGKMGYRYRYTCESCGFDIVTKTELSE